jgi:toxin ParE1/3/4
MKLVFSGAFEDDLEQIADYIALDNPNRALSFTREIRARCRQLIDHPESGATRNEIRPGIRILPFWRYVIYYKIEADHVWIARVLHSARDIKDLL